VTTPALWGYGYFGSYGKEMSQLYLKKEMELFENQARVVDVIITTALIPGKRAPMLVSKQCVAAMKRGMPFYAGYPDFWIHRL